eukprot:GHVU01016438.1.p3 GENE.GHVU01016438.1~~GHVU01016438.1.p3  ORF type:complete len:117 (+),score=16.15 GHVU01016438.1:396-746(+)
MFVISSDFCHWGDRFRYTYLPRSDIPVSTAIKQLDMRGVEFVTKHDFDGFDEYLRETDNTICGRNGIKVLLKLIGGASGGSPPLMKTRLLAYSQSEELTEPSGSSVSYAAIVTQMV